MNRILKAALIGAGVGLGGILAADAAFNGVSEAIRDLREFDRADAEIFATLAAISAVSGVVATVTA